MLIYLLQRVWFNGGFKREYCSVKILEYSIWIFKVAVKEFGGAGSARRRTTGAGVSEPWQPGAGAAAGRVRAAPQGLAMPLPWTIGPGDSSPERLMNKRMTSSIMSSFKYLKVG